LERAPPSCDPKGLDLGADSGEKHLMMRDVQTDAISRRPLAGMRGWLISR
jgi:hypothetical protein